LGWGVGEEITGNPEIPKRESWRGGEGVSYGFLEGGTGVSGKGNKMGVWRRVTVGDQIKVDMVKPQ